MASDADGKLLAAALAFARDRLPVFPCEPRGKRPLVEGGFKARKYLKDLAWRVAHPDAHAAPPLTDILTKLADAGLDLYCRHDF